MDKEEICNRIENRLTKLRKESTYHFDKAREYEENGEDGTLDAKISRTLSISNVARIVELQWVLDMLKSTD